MPMNASCGMRAFLTRTFAKMAAPMKVKSRLTQ
jgi:hypothetical protein